MQGLVWFTDGFKNDKGIEAVTSIQGSGCNLDLHTSVFQAEVRVIAEWAQGILETDCRRKPVVICSDSQAALGGALKDTC